MERLIIRPGFIALSSLCRLTVFKDGEHQFSSVSVIFWPRLAVRFSSKIASIASSKAKFLFVESGAQSSFEFAMDFQIHFCAFDRQYRVFEFLDNYRVAGYGISLLHLSLRGS